MSIMQKLKDTKLEYRGIGLFNNIAISGNSSNFDYVLSEDLWLSDLSIILSGHVLGDTIDIQIIHSLAGVVSQFVFGWYVDPFINSQPMARAPIMPSRLKTGLIIRVVYNSIGSNDVTITTNGWFYGK